MPVPFAPRRSAMLVCAIALALSFAAVPAQAEPMYPGESVKVDPAAAGGRVLYYPGRKYKRVVPPLLQPGQKSRTLAPLRLHMPTKHHRTARHRKKKATHEVHAPAPTRQRTAMTPPAPARKTPPSTPPAPTRSATPATIPLSLGQGDAKPQRRAAAPRKPAATPKPKRTTTASLPKTAPVHGLSKQAAILFDQDSSALSGSSTARLKDLAFSLMTALANGAGQIELIGYGGAPGDKSSTARRISLKRALAVRQALIVDGVPANRIDVRALGGVNDQGATDRVDIFVKG